MIDRCRWKRHQESARHQCAGGEFDRLAELAAELVRLNVDVIVAFCRESARAAQTATVNSSVVVTAFIHPMKGPHVPIAATELTGLALVPELLPKLAVLAPSRLQ